jgi:hypothetical protein
MLLGKSAHATENKGVAFCLGAKERVSVWEVTGNARVMFLASRKECATG